MSLDREVIQNSILVVWMAAFVFLTAALIVTLCNWRKDAPSTNMLEIGMDLGRHPERYIAASAVSRVKCLQLVGATLFAFDSLALVALSVAMWL
jgi:hypothetical protein